MEDNLMRGLIGFFLGTVLLLSAAGCGPSENKAVIPDNVPPPPTRESTQPFSAVTNSPSLPESERKTN